MEAPQRSEVARLMEEIELAYEAARLALSGYAITAKHTFISARQEHIALCHEELRQLVGEQEAMKLMCEAQDRVMKEEL
ncbi:MAG TPA: hypothetical protein VFA41_00275 [Ktedonobacteraceae bacterium]|jgi:hypothetical protein|nr:hypothetical protein [Ktedonobacteraceae bacterium]